MTHCSHTDLPPLGRCVQPWGLCSAIIVTTEIPISPAVSRCQSLLSLHPSSIWPSIYCICPSVPVDHHWLIMASALIHVPLNDQSKSWSPARVAWRESTWRRIWLVCQDAKEEHRGVVCVHKRGVTRAYYWAKSNIEITEGQCVYIKKRGANPSFHSVYPADNPIVISVCVCVCTLSPFVQP